MNKITFIYESLLYDLHTENLQEVVSILIEFHLKTKIMKIVIIIVIITFK